MVKDQGQFSGLWKNILSFYCLIVSFSKVFDPRGIMYPIDFPVMCSKVEVKLLVFLLKCFLLNNKRQFSLIFIEFDSEVVPRRSTIPYKFQIIWSKNKFKQLILPRIVLSICYGHLLDGYLLLATLVDSQKKMFPIAFWVTRSMSNDWSLSEVSI